MTEKSLKNRKELPDLTRKANEMTNQKTTTTIYVVSYGEYKIPDKEYADGFRWAWCEGIAVGAYTDRAVAEAVAMASERGHLTSVRLNEVSENYRHILEGMGRDQQLPAQSQTDGIMRAVAAGFLASAEGENGECNSFSDEPLSTVDELLENAEGRKLIERIARTII